MIRMIKRWFYNKRVSRALRSQAKDKWLAGELSASEYVRIRDAADDRAFIDRFMRELEADKDLLGGPRWDNFIVWLKDNWPTILKLLLSLLVVLETDE